MIQVKRQFGLGRPIVYILIWALATAGVQGGGQQMQKILEGRKVLIIIASDKFRDEEFGEPFAVLAGHGAVIRVACSRLGQVRGMLGRQVAPDCLLADCKAADFDAILFIGGQGATEYFNSAEAHRIAREAANSGKVLGAICIAPVILAKAGILKGKKATVFPSEEEQFASLGAILVRRDVVTDGRIVTAAGPQAAKEFSETIANLLK